MISTVIKWLSFYKKRLHVTYFSVPNNMGLVDCYSFYFCQI